MIWLDGAFFQQGRIVNNQPKEKDFLKFMNLDPFLGKDDDRTSFQDFPQPLNTRVRKRFCNGFPSINPLGKPTPSKTDEFSEKFRRGGNFQSKNLCCKIWTFKQGYLTMKFEGFVDSLKILQHNFPIMRGGVKGRWNFSKNSSVLEEIGIPNWLEFVKEDNRH